MAYPSWYQKREEEDDEEEKSSSIITPTKITNTETATDNSSQSVTKFKTSTASSFGAALLDKGDGGGEQYTPDIEEDTESSMVSSDMPSWYKDKNQSQSSKISTGAPSWYTPKEEEPIPPLYDKAAGPDLPPSSGKALSGAAKNLADALAKKVIPKGVLNDKALRFGQAVGWCGVYAGSLSTASNVGDYWYQKITKVTHRDGIGAGDKIVIPLGVSYDKSGKPLGYGHVMTSLTPQDKYGNILIAHSNADGRQNKNAKNLGVVSYAIYNVNDLNKRYGKNWGAVKGKLKVNPFLPGAASQVGAAFSNSGAPSKDASAKELAAYVVNNGISDLKGQGWWDNAKNKKEAWKIIQNTAPADNSESATVTNNGGRSALQILGGVALKVGVNQAAGFINRLKGPSNDQAPPEIDKTDYSPQALADYVLENNITDLSNKKWWINSPAKAEAWKLINKRLGRAEYFTEGATISQGEIKKTDQKALDAISESIMGIVDPNNYFSPGLTDNQVAKRSDVKGNLNQAAKLTQERIAEVQTENENNWWVNNPVGNAIYGSIGTTAEGVKQLTGGETGNDTNVVAGVKNTVFGGLGLVSPGVATFNVTTQMPGIKPVVEATFEKWQGVKDAIKTMPLKYRNGEPVYLNRDAQELLDLGLDIGLFSLLHKGSKQVVKGAKALEKEITTKKVTYSGAEVKDVLRDIMIDSKKAYQNMTPLKAELKKIFEGVEDGVKQREMLKSSYKNGITVREARDFTAWFNKFFDGLRKKGGAVEAKVSPQFQKLLTDGKKAANGDLSVVTFTKQAREVLVKGESATLRDLLPAIKEKAAPAMYDSAQGGALGKGPMVIDQIAQAETRLSQLQEQGKKPAVVVEANNTKALSIDTYTYSDGKVGVGFSLSTDAQSVHAPINGVFETPREAVKAVVPIIEKTIASESDLASEAIRVEIDKLKEAKYSTIPNKGEIAPWEYEGKEPAINVSAKEVKNMSKQEIEGEIKEILDDYIKTALKNGKGQGVIATQRGRKSNNDNWYVKLWKENGGKRPTKEQIREVAKNHLINGVTDRSIGEMPPNVRFKQLVDRLPIAKPARTVKSRINEMNAVTERVAEFKSTISTPESRMQGSNAPIISEGKTMQSTQRIPEGTKAPEYKKVTLSEQVAKAEKFVEENFELSKKIMRNLDSVPEDLDRGSVLSALRDKAADMKDTALETEAQIALNKYKTRTAQDLALLKGDLSTTDYFVRQLLEARTKVKSSFSIEEKSVKESLEAEVTRLRQQIKDGMLADEKGNIPKTPKQRRASAIKQAQNILDALTCK